MSTNTKKTPKKTPIRVVEPLSKKPVARFFFQGRHTHPVRRTVLLTGETKDNLIGYEFREGSTVRDAAEALWHHKRYPKNEISRWGDYKRLRLSAKGWWRDPQASTLERTSIISLFKDGA